MVVVDFGLKPGRHELVCRRALYHWADGNSNGCTKRHKYIKLSRPMYY